MSGALEELHKVSQAEVTLKSGTVYLVQPPRFEDCLAHVGDVPLPVLEEIARRQQAEEQGTDTDPPTLEEIAAVAHIDAAYAVLCVKAVNGVPVEDETIMPADIPAEDFKDLRDYAKRDLPLPGKA